MNLAKLLKLLGFPLSLLAFGLSGEVCLAAEEKLEELCPGKLWVRAPHKISLSENEKVLVCGTSSNPAWKEVPLSQAMVHLRASLQTRAFHFAELKHENGRAIVDTGPQVFVNEIYVGGKPPEGWDVKRFRKVIGEPLTPALLEGFQKRVESDLKHHGYACPKIETQAVAESGRIQITVHPGYPDVIRNITADSVEGLSKESLTRFHAFYPGYAFDSHAMLLSGIRTESDGILQSTFFETKCASNFVDLNQRHLAGAPRILRMGAGLNTERGVIGYIDWKHARIGKMGSSLNLGAKFSYRDLQRNIQQLTATGKWFGFHNLNRLYIDTSAAAVHESHENFHTLTINTSVTPTITWDSQNFGGIVGLGPTFNEVMTFRGAGRPRTFYSTLKGYVRIIQHTLELNYGDPSAGLELRVQGELSDNSLLSDISAQTLGVDGRWLWNLGDLSPATFILGIRWRFNTTFAPDSTGGYNSLPVSLRNYLGGSGDVRGYALKELPGPQGAPTIAYLGTEMRFAEIFPWGLQPLALFDVGRAGSQSLWLDSPVYLSAGPGLRWASPIGVFRATLAKGWAVGKSGVESQRNYSMWQFLLGYGEEF